MPYLKIDETAMEKRLKEIEDLPNTVINWKVNFGIDHAYKPVAFVTITVEDDDITDENIRYDKKTELFEMITNLVRDMTYHDRFVYVDIHMPSDPT